MTKKRIWLTGALVALTIAAVALMGAQSNVSQDATIQDLLDLLTTEDGLSRLDVIEGMLEDIDREVDLVYAVAEQMLDDQYGFFAAEEWNTSDIKDQLNQIEIQLDEIKTKTDCMSCSP
ncbi:hypothetical protein IH601_07745 [Candidatus Bipolaricaulota bacterium]|nr:hypothetical protein [Candidatus Bipolaricaulota bacterium]